MALAYTIDRRATLIWVRRGGMLLEQRSLPNGLEGWGEFKRQMGYKTLWSKKTLVMVDPWFPSTKRCSQCHEQKASVPLNVRIFDCDACGHLQGRDVNAAVNLAQYAQQILNASPEVPGQDKTPEPMRLERTSVVPRGPIPRKRKSPARKSDGTARAH